MVIWLDRTEVKFPSSVEFASPSVRKNGGGVNSPLIPRAAATSYRISYGSYEALNG